MMWPKDVEEATWEEYSELYKKFYRTVTVSEYDRQHKAVVYCSEQNIPSTQAATVNGCSDSDIAPINFQSHYHIVTHQGIFKDHFVSFFYV